MKDRPANHILYTKPSFTPEELAELKRIHCKHTGEVLSDTEAIEIGTRLLILFTIIAQPIHNQ